MTLTVSLATRDSIWTLADRQLNAGETVSSTNACKIVGIDSTDGIALVGYAGVGMIAGTDPADWMTAVFKDHKTDLRGYMVALAEAANDAIPPSERSTRPGHLFVAAGVVDGEPIQYSLVSSPTGALSLRVFEQPTGFMLAGAGGAALRENSAQMIEDATELIDWIRRVETDEAHPREVADRLIKWNPAAGRESGSHAIIAYRLIRDGEVAPGRCFYNGTKLEPPDSKVPQITRGVDTDQIMDLMKKQAMGGRLSIEELALLKAYKKAEAGE